MSADLPQLNQPSMAIDFQPVRMEDTLTWDSCPGSPPSNNENALHYFRHRLSHLQLPPQITRPEHCRFKVVVCSPSQRQLRNHNKYLLSTWRNHPSGKIYYLYCYQT